MHLVKHAILAISGVSVHRLMLSGVLVGGNAEKFPAGHTPVHFGVGTDGCLDQCDRTYAKSPQRRYGSLSYKRTAFVAMPCWDNFA